MVTLPAAEAPGAMLPTNTGIGVAITGVQAGPEVCVSVTPVIPAELATPGPWFASVIVDALALAGPDLAVMIPESAVGPGMKLAVTEAGPVRAAVVVEALEGLPTAPVQL